MASQRKLGVVIPLIIVGVLVLLAGGGYLGYKFFAAGKVEQEVKQAIADLEKASPGLQIKYDTMAMSWQTGRVNLKNLKVSHKDNPATLHCGQRCGPGPDRGGHHPHPQLHHHGQSGHRRTQGQSYH
jgi:hypothetical protein